MKIPTTVKDIINEYVRTRKFIALSESSSRQYISAMNKIEELLGDTKLSALRRSDVLRAVEYLGRTPAIANRFARVCSILFNYAVDMDYIQANPAARVRKARLGEWARWETKEVAAVIALKHRIVSTAVALAYYTGQRESDVLNMRWSDIDGDTITVVQKKTGHRLEIKISPALKAYLKTLDHKGAKNDFIVSGKKPLNPNSFRNLFKRTTRAIKIDLPFHGIRKTVGSHLAERGRSTNEIAALLGHKTLTMAAHYTRQANSKKMIASAVNDLTFD